MFSKSKTYNEDLLTSISASVGIERLRDKTILITGATGTIGSYLIDMLLKYNEQGAGIRIIAANFDMEALHNRFDDVKTEFLSYAAHNILGDIKWDFDCDYIIHTAGFAFPDAFTKNPVGTDLGRISPAHTNCSTTQGSIKLQDCSIYPVARCTVRGIFLLMYSRKPTAGMLIRPLLVHATPEASVQRKRCALRTRSSSGLKQ